MPSLHGIRSNLPGRILLLVISACSSNKTQVPSLEDDFGGAMASAGPFAGGLTNSGGSSGGRVSGGSGDSHSGASGILSGGTGTASSSAGTTGSSMTTGTGGAAFGGRGGNPGGAPTAGTADGGSASCGSSAGCADIEQTCLASAVDECERCLCTNCTEAVQRCGETDGCPEILSCIREQGCEGVACYCGTFDAIACAARQSNGPCKSVVLQAPGASEPTLLNPSAGPASDAALAIADCANPGRPCAEECPMSP